MPTGAGTGASPGAGFCCHADYTSAWHIMRRGVPGTVSRTRGAERTTSPHTSGSSGQRSCGATLPPTPTAPTRATTCAISTWTCSWQRRRGRIPGGMPRRSITITSGINAYATGRISPSRWTAEISKRSEKPCWGYSKQRNRVACILRLERRPKPGRGVPFGVRTLAAWLGSGGIGTGKGAFENTNCREGENVREEACPASGLVLHARSCQPSSYDR